ncbi:MAG: hypothetical protein PHI63_05980 [Patescibacteria group bacterium]|nr:hypothetical protein [Patescibacteria group bacterium]
MLHLRIPRFRSIQLMTLTGACMPAIAHAQMGRIMHGALLNTAKVIGFGDSPKSFIQILGAYTQGVIAFLGLVFLVLVIWGGFKWMTAAGNETQVEAAKKIVRNATIGLAIILLARIITSLFLEIIKPAVI